TRDIAEMDRCLAGGDRAGRHDEFEHWDAALHAALFSATRNPLLIHMYDAVQTARRSVLWGASKVRHDSVEHRAMYQQQHRAVVEAVRDRNTADAVTAMKDHLAYVAATILTSIP
ncbi:MAG: FadR/GntR family transcriptional regulator, partial [Nocardioidaceae bacterium]